MKTTKTTKRALIFFTLFMAFINAKPFMVTKMAEPVTVEVKTKFSKMGEALAAAKNALLVNKFIAANGVQATSFSATRTTGSKADYYVADVTASEEGGKIKIKITFVKIGTGLKSLKKMAEDVKTELEKNSLQ